MFRCGHCVKFAPEFEEASEILKTAAPSVTLFQVSTFSLEYLYRGCKIHTFLKYNKQTLGMLNCTFSVSCDVSLIGLLNGKLES